MKTTSALVLAAVLAACSSSQQNTATTTPEPTPPPPAPSAEPTPAPTPEPVAQPEPTPPPPAAPAPFAPTDEDRAAWANAEHVLDYNARANFGGGALRTGFTPDPWPFPLTAGGGRNPVDVSTLNMKDSVSGEVCGRSFVTRRPDFHFNFEAGTTFPLLRFYVVTENNADATLVINEPGAAWRCNDDHHHDGWSNNLMPTIDFHNPPAGRYDIWVGTYDASHNNRARLFVTELDTNHP